MPTTTPTPETTATMPTTTPTPETSAPTTTARRRRTPKQARAARENGKRGGRPRKNRHFEDFAELGAPPTHPLDLAHWMQRVVALDTGRIQADRADKELSKKLRGYAGAMSKLLMPTIMMTALDPDAAWREGVDADAPPPDDPLGAAYWLLLALAAGVDRLIRGEPDPHGGELKTSVAAYVKIMPPDVMFQAQRKLVRDRAALEADAGPQPQPSKEPENGREQRYQPLSC
jgi:hypothetical protein